MAIQFFLKHELVRQIIAEYKTDVPPKPDEYKGLVFSVEFQQVDNSHQYVATAKIEGANGKPNALGVLPPIANTFRTPCPHPPPCQSDGAGGFRFDSSDPFVGSCY